MCVCDVFVYSVSLHVCVGECTHIHQRAGYQVLCLLYSLIPLGPKLSLNQELGIFAATLARQQVLAILCVCLPESWGYRHAWPSLASDMSDDDSTYVLMLAQQDVFLFTH